MSKKKVSKREYLRRKQQSEGCLGVEYKGGFKFTKKKDGYLLEEDDR